MRAMSRGLMRELAAEFLGTFVLIAFGVGVVAQTVLSAGASGGYLTINLCWGLAVTLGVLMAGGVSGARKGFGSGKAERAAGGRESVFCRVPRCGRWGVQCAGGVQATNPRCAFPDWDCPAPGRAVS